MADRIIITLKGDKRVQGKLKNLPKTTRMELSKSIRETCEEIKKDAEFFSPRDTDKLVSGWKVEMASELEGRVFNKEKHGIFMETGFKLEERSKTGWRFIPIEDAASRYTPFLLLNERERHPRDKPEGHRMLEQAGIRNEKTLSKKVNNILGRAYRRA